MRDLKGRQTAALTPPAFEVEEIDATYVALKTANVRAEPSTSSAKVGRLGRDSGISVTGKVAGGKWLRVEQADGTLGYVFGTLLAPADAGEVAAWLKVRDTKKAEEVGVFLRHYPSGHFAARAKQLKAALMPQVAAVTPQSAGASVARPPDGGELPEGTVRQQYQDAFNKLKTRNYAYAEKALRIFVDRYPDDPLAGDAMYWMGETHYVRKQYSEAVRIFLDAYQRFPKGNKAPDNLFKLAKSLSQIGENRSACVTYAELVKTFPSATQRILSGARSEMFRLGCSAR